MVEHGSTTAMVIVGCGQRRKEKEKNKERKKDEGRTGERSEKIEILWFLRGFHMTHFLLIKILY